MQFITENYLIIILVGLFFVFSLMGYLIDIIRNNKNTNQESNNEIKPVEISELKDINLQQNTVVEEKNNIDNKDELLENYDKTIEK